MDKIVVRYLKPEEYPVWEDFVDKNENGTIFHHYYWYEFIVSASSRTDLSILGCFIGGRLVAGTILAVRKRGFLKFMVAPFATPFYGILIEERETKFLSKKENYRLRIIREFLKVLHRECHFIGLSFTPGFMDIRGFSWEKYAGQVFYTYRTELSDPGKVYDAFLPALKRQIKKGEKLSYEVKTSLEDDHLKAIYDLILKSYRRQDHPFRFSFGQIKKILEIEEIRQKVRLFSIWLDNKPVSSMIIMVDKACSYYWLAGSDPEYFSSGLNQVLMWKVLQDLAQSGVGCFDFVGANTETITRYKSSFNFELIPFYHVSKATLPWLKLLLFLKGIPS